MTKEEMIAFVEKHSYNSSKGTERYDLTKDTKIKVFGSMKNLDDFCDKYKISENKFSYYYVFRCCHGKYYIGYSTLFKKRMYEHLSDRSRPKSMWTRLYPPLYLYAIYQAGNLPYEPVIYETALTLHYMQDFGIDNVRGGYLVHTNRNNILNLMSKYNYCEYLDKQGNMMMSQRQVKEYMKLTKLYQVTKEERLQMIKNTEHFLFNTKNINNISVAT